MIYSCFDARRGVYDYYATDSSLPVNADLPTPRLADNTRIGTPAVDAAREMPRGARPIGSGWHARGVIVRCNASGLGRVFDHQGSVETGFLMFMCAVGGAYAADAFDKSMGMGALVGAAVGLAVGFATREAVVS